LVNTVCKSGFVFKLLILFSESFVFSAIFAKSVLVLIEVGFTSFLNSVDNQGFSS
jgi:hypothetical protein